LYITDLVGVKAFVWMRAITLDLQVGEGGSGLWLKLGEEGVEDEIIWGREKEWMIHTRGLDKGPRWR